MQNGQKKQGTGKTERLRKEKLAEALRRNLLRRKAVKAPPKRSEAP